MDARGTFVRRLLLPAVVAIAACKDGPVTPTQQQPAAVSIAAPTNVIVVGGSVTLTANVYDATSKLIPGATVTWNSLTPTVASVSASGIVTGLAVGNATIEANASGFTSTVAITVDPDPCTNPIDLAVGQVRTLSGPAAVSCITLAATSGATDFLFVTANADQAQDYKGSIPSPCPLATSRRPRSRSARSCSTRAPSSRSRKCSWPTCGKTGSGRRSGRCFPGFNPPCAGA